MRKYFTKHADYLKILSHENDCYLIWKVKRLKHEKIREFDKERDKLLMKMFTDQSSKKKEKKE